MSYLQEHVPNTQIEDAYSEPKDMEAKQRYFNYTLELIREVIKPMIEDKNPKRTSISELGEFGLIDHLTKNFEIVQESTLKGIGDDAAVLDFKDKKRNNFV